MSVGTVFSQLRFGGTLLLQLVEMRQELPQAGVHLVVARHHLHFAHPSPYVGIVREVPQAAEVRSALTDFDVRVEVGDRERVAGDELCLREAVVDVSHDVANDLRDRKRNMKTLFDPPLPARGTPTRHSHVDTIC